MFILANCIPVIIIQVEKLLVGRYYLNIPKIFSVRLMLEHEKSLNLVPLNYFPHFPHHDFLLRVSCQVSKHTTKEEFQMNAISTCIGHKQSPYREHPCLGTLLPKKGQHSTPDAFGSV